MIGTIIGIIIGFILGTIACMVYGQYALRDIAHNKQIVTINNGRTWEAYVPGAEFKYYSRGCLTENEAAGHVYLQVKHDLLERYKKPSKTPKK